MDPVAHIIEFERCDEAWKAGAHLIHGKRVEFFQTVRFPPHEKGGLRDFGAFPSGGQIEIRFCGAVVIQGTVKAGAPELGHVMNDVTWLSP